MIAAIPSATLLGVQGCKILVEVHVSSGLPGFTIVGLPDAACREARDRVRAALLSSSLPWPMRRVTVNLAPSGVRKAGAGLDLPIAVGLLVASGEVDQAAVKGCGFVGELGLDGTLRSVPGVLPVVAAIGTDAVVVPWNGVYEALLVGGPVVRTARSLGELADVLRGRAPWPELPEGAGAGRRRLASLSGAGASRGASAGSSTGTADDRSPDLAEVRGQVVGRRAIEVAAAGAHHLLMSGPPGSGKTMLAQRLPGILPPLDREAVIEVCRIHSSAGLPLPERTLAGEPPFRAPHHSSSAVSLLGGGTYYLRPGEISLATNGVLFLDELAEFPAAVLDALRQPLEERVIRIARARATATLPASFLLVGAMNPCPCGQDRTYLGCECSEQQLDRYRRRLSAPLLDRFDLHIAVDQLSTKDLFATEVGESSEVVAGRVATAREMARGRGIACNAMIPAHRLDELAPLDPKATALLRRRVNQSSLSARGLDRVRRVARTLADLQQIEGPVPAVAAATALELRAGRGGLVGGRWVA